MSTVRELILVVADPYKSSLSHFREVDKTRTLAKRYIVELSEISFGVRKLRMSSVGYVPDGRYILAGDSNYEKKDGEKSEDFKREWERRWICQ